MIKEQNDYLSVKEAMKIDIGETVTVSVESKVNFRKYLSDLSKREQMKFITRTPDKNLDSLEVIRFK